MQRKKIPHFNTIEPNLSGLSAELKAIAKIVKDQMEVFAPEQTVLDWWKLAVEDWANNESFPLFIRKFNESYPRGSHVKHSSGRIIIPSDNGVAHWAMSAAYNGIMPEPEDITRMIKQNEIPTAFVLKGYEKNEPNAYTKHELDNPNQKGWKIAHIDPVGLKSRTKLEDLPIEDLKSHFIKFVDPNNMFLFPKSWVVWRKLMSLLKYLRRRNGKSI